MVAIKKKERENTDWKGAPPCLVTLASRGFAQGSRNECLFQVGIYLRQRFQDTELEQKLDEYNLKYFHPPLPSKEVQTLLNQVSDKKNYFYRCKLPVFKDVCEEMKCKNTKFGIGKGTTSSIVSLKKFVSDDPMFEVTHNGKVLVIDGDTLAEFPRYRRACVKQINESPQPIRGDAWADKVQSLFDDPGFEEVIMPGEVSSNGQFLSYLQIFIENNGGAKDRQDMLQGMVYEQENNYMFKPQAFRDFLKTKRFNKLSDVGQFKVFSDFKGTAEKLRINDKVTHIWKIPTTVNDAEYIVKSKDFKEEDPY